MLVGPLPQIAIGWDGREKDFQRGEGRLTRRLPAPDYRRPISTTSAGIPGEQNIFITIVTMMSAIHMSLKSRKDKKSFPIVRDQCATGLIFDPVFA